VETFYNCHTLYVNSLITLISLGICEDQTLQDFKEDENDLVSDSERACMWGKIALAYHLSGDEEMFRSVGDQFLPTDYRCFSPGEQKWLIFQISPTLYLRGQLKFFTLLEEYDDVFRDVCLKRVCAFIISKKLNVMELDIRTTYELTYSDFNDLNMLIDHMTDENEIFQIVEVIARSLRTTKSAIVEKKLPAPGGISHDGYKIASQAILEYSLRAFNTAKKEVWEKRLQTVDNKADRAFLYFYIAPFFSKHSDKEDFFRRGVGVTKDVNFTFDRVSRLDMAFTECAINNLGILMPALAEEAILCLKTDGTEEQYEELLDTIHQYKPELAESIMVKLDQDPARVYNKRKLQSHLDSVKRIAKAGKDITTIGDLNHDEQRKFFEERLKNLQNGKGQILSVEDVFTLTIAYLYNNSLNDAMPSIHYLLETISQRQKMNKNCKDLLLSMHQVIRYNLRVVLSLATDTKERMEQVNSMFGSTPAAPEGFIGIGEYQKGVEYLLHWYQECGYDELTIIDPHFSPTDLSVIKLLTDENNDLVIRILAHKGDFYMDDFKSEWRKVSAGVKTPIQVMLVKYVGKSYGGPIHDRYWICVDDENDKRVGISLNSISGLGRRESSILPIDDSTALYALHSYSRYANRKIKRDDNMELEYEDFTLD